MTESDFCIFYFSLKGNTPINKISSSDGFFLVFGKLIHIELTERNFHKFVRFATKLCWSTLRINIKRERGFVTSSG